MNALEEDGENCPKCCGRGVDSRGRVCEYHRCNPERLARFICQQKEQLDQKDTRIKELEAPDRERIEKIITVIEAGDCLCDEQPCWSSFGRRNRRRKGQVCGARDGVVREIREELGVPVGAEDPK
jgi:hypothetical protein